MIENFLNNIIPTIQHFGVFGYWLILLIFFAEAIVFIGLFIPGAILAVVFGTLAAKGIFHLGDLILFSSIGFFLGDLLSFYLGRKGTSLFKDENLVLKYAHLEKGEVFFDKHGSKSIILARFIGVLRPLAPFVAGLSKMKAQKFFILNTFGILLWVIMHILVGYFFGQALVLVKLWVTRAELLFFLLVIFFAIFYFLKWLIFKKGKNFWLLLGLLVKIVWQEIINSKTIKKYPKFAVWLNNRSISDNFYGLPLSIIIGILVYLTISFLNIIYLILNTTTLIDIDGRFESLMHLFRNSHFTKIFLVITYLGQVEIILALAFGFSLFLLIYKKRQYIASLWIILFGSILSGQIIKFLIHRPRPLESFYLENGYSFPSQHSILAMSFFGYLAYFFIRNQKSWNKKLNYVFSCLFIVILIGFSRLYLGVHYLSDVWGGFILGLLWLTIGIGLLEWRIYDKQEITSTPFAAKFKTVSYGLVIIELIFFMGFVYQAKSKINLTQIEPLPEIVSVDILKTFSDLNLSRYGETLDGEKQEPLNVIISAKDDQEATAALKKSGWLIPDSPSFNSFSKNLKATTLNKNYPEAPITPSFWQTEVNDLAFEKPTAKNSVRQRHHLKLWKTNFTTPNGRNIYVGIVGLDIGVNWSAIHKIDPNIDAERESLFKELKKNKTISSWSKHQFVQPIIGNKRFSGPFFTDGNIYIVDLR